MLDYNSKYIYNWLTLIQKKANNPILLPELLQIRFSFLSTTLFYHFQVLNRNTKRS